MAVTDDAGKGRLTWSCVFEPDGVSEEEALKFVTLNPAVEPAPSSVIAEFDYHHPQYSFASLQTQAELPTLNGQRKSWFCGSYFGYGFHEDAFASGLAVAARLANTRSVELKAEVGEERLRVHG